MGTTLPVILALVTFFRKVVTSSVQSLGHEAAPAFFRGGGAAGAKEAGKRSDSAYSA
jgi:hypothetical protein